MYLNKSPSSKRQKTGNNIVPIVDTDIFERNNCQQQHGQPQTSYNCKEVDTQNVISSKTTTTTSSASNYLQSIGLDKISLIWNQKIPRKNASRRIPVNTSGKNLNLETDRIRTSIIDTKKICKLKNTYKVMDKQNTETVTKTQENIKSIKNKSYKDDKNIKHKYVKEMSKTNPKNLENYCTSLKRNYKQNSSGAFNCLKKDTKTTNKLLKQSINNSASICTSVEKNVISKTSEKKTKKLSNLKNSRNESENKCNVNNKINQNKKKNRTASPQINTDLKKILNIPECTTRDTTSIKSVVAIKKEFNDLNDVTVLDKIDSKTVELNTNIELKQEKKIYKDRKAIQKDKLDLKHSRAKNKKPFKCPIIKKAHKEKSHRKIKIVINVIYNNKQNSPKCNTKESNKTCAESNIDLDFLNDFNVDEIIESLETCDSNRTLNKEITLKTDDRHKVNSNTNIHCSNDALDLIKILKGEEDDNVIKQSSEISNELLVGNLHSTHYTENYYMLDNILTQDTTKDQSAMPFKIEDNQITDMFNEMKDERCVLIGDTNSKNYNKTILTLETNKLKVKSSDDTICSRSQLQFGYDAHNCRQKNEKQHMINKKTVEDLKHNISSDKLKKFTLSRNIVNDIKDNKNGNHTKETDENNTNQQIGNKKSLSKSNHLVYNAESVAGDQNRHKLKEYITHKEETVEHLKTFTCMKIPLLENIDTLKNIEYNNARMENSQYLNNSFVTYKQIQVNTSDNVNIKCSVNREKCDSLQIDKTEYINDIVKNSFNKVDQTKSKYHQKQEDGNDIHKEKTLQLNKECSGHIIKHANIILIDNPSQEKLENNKSCVLNLLKDGNTQEIKKTANKKQIDHTGLNQAKHNNDQKNHACDNNIEHEQPENTSTRCYKTITNPEEKESHKIEKMSRDKFTNSIQKLSKSPADRKNNDDDEAVVQPQSALLSPLYNIKSNIELNTRQKLEEIMAIYFKTKYSVTAIINNGKFSKVYKCKHPSGKYYALKMLKNNRSMDMKKKQMLYSLQNNIPKNNLYTVFILSAIILVDTGYILMEYYPKNMTQILNENKKPFSIDQVQDYARQLVTAVMFLKNNDMVHSDIKPNHVLINSSNNLLKLCGFDCLCYINNMKVLPNLGTVNYRAPEIILGFTSGFEIDVWSTALVLFEIATKKKLFPGSFNNDILFKQICTLGFIPNDMIKKSRFANIHFCGSTFIRRMGFNRKSTNVVKKFKKNSKLHDFIYNAYFNNWIHQRTMAQKVSDMKKIDAFVNLLQKMLAIHPEHRLAMEYVYSNLFIYDPYEYQGW